VCLGKPQVVPALLDELMKLHLGQVNAVFSSNALLSCCCDAANLQGLDIYYRDNGICPSEQQYCEMVQHKTAGLFRLGITLLQASASTLLPRFQTHPHASELQR
jgi:geranylgeranyl pyrophosphate synthase